LAGATPAQAHATARILCGIDTGRFLPGTPEFKNAFNQVIANPDVLSGSKFKIIQKFIIQMQIIILEIFLKFAEIQVGGSYSLI
jgi:hypothetical protein